MMNLWGINTDAKLYVKNIQNVSMIFYRLVCGIMYTCLRKKAKTDELMGNKYGCKSVC